MAGQNTYLESDGKSVGVDLLYAVDKGDVVVVEGWLGVANKDGASGEHISLSIDQREYQFTVPASLDVSKGEVVYITVATLTGHRPQDAAWTKTAGAGKVALFRATSDKDSNDVVTGILMNGWAS